jgi:probable HAF family extracellular repeat protein
MKKLTAKTLIGAALLVLAAAAAGAGASRDSTVFASYHLDNLDSLGGTSSVGYSVNDRGWVAGRSNLPGNQTRHASLWRNGQLTDLRTLGGANSAVLWPVKNLRGIVSGIAQTNEPDPYNEKWSCGFFFPAATGRGARCLGFTWKNGVMTRLPTLGGTHGFATGTNNLGQTTGWAENTIHDPTCESPQVLQFRAVVWGPRRGQIRQLRPLPGDTVTAATALNDFGRVVGISGICDQAAGRFSAIHNVIWDNGGPPVDIGDFGGVAWNTPMAVNEQGAVVGFANASAAAGGNLVPLAFLWTESQGIRSLNTLPGDVTSQATGINEWGQIVGQSCDVNDNCRGFLWENGVMRDLNDLVVSGDEDLITTANDIDNFGRITGQAVDSTGNFVAFLATPTHD